MPRYAKRVPFSHFTPPPRSIVDNLDWENVAELLTGSGVFTDTQITELKDVWYKYLLLDTQYKQELMAEDYQKLSKYFDEHLGRMFEIISNPSNSNEEDIVSAIDSELKFNRMEGSFEDFLFIAKLAIEKRLAKKMNEGVEYGNAFEDLIQMMRDWAQLNGIPHKDRDDDGQPSKFSEAIYTIHKSLPDNFRTHGPISANAVAKRIARHRAKQNKA